MSFYDEFSPEKLRQPAQTQTFRLDGDTQNLRIDFLAFNTKQNSSQPPVIILSGAFQSFASFQLEVESLIRSHPVIIIEMPSQGMNTQRLVNFSLHDYAKLLHLFITHNQLTKINLIGLSYGSAVALIYAASYPALCERLILSGITCFKRTEIMTLLEDSLELLSQREMESYASLALCNLINHNRLEKTGINQAHRRLLYRQVKTLNDNLCQIHIENTQRLMRFEGFKHYPSCPTLVVAGEFDSFTQPDEQAATAKNCSNATFVVIHNADHLVQLEQPESMAKLGCAFFNHHCLDDISGISVFDSQRFILEKHCISPLKQNLKIQATLEDKNAKQQPVCLVELNVSEFKFTTTSQLDIQSDKLKLIINDINCEFYIHILSNNKNKQAFNGIFSHQNMKKTELLIKLIETLD